MNNLDLAIVGPLGIRRFELDKKCETNEGHKHNYDHTTIVIRGGIKVIYSYEKDGKLIEGESAEFRQGQAIAIKKDVLHTIKALEDNTQYVCVFSHRDFDGQIIENYNGHSQAYF